MGAGFPFRGKVARVYFTGCIVQDLNPGREKIFLFSKMPRQCRDPTQPSVKEWQDIFPALNWPGLEVGH